jgi:uncharacterized protein (DUF924 family)
VNRVVVENHGRQVRNLFKRASAGLEKNLVWVRQYSKIVRRFGRSCHRNTIPGRTGSSDETERLTSPGAFSS